MWTYYVERMHRDVYKTLQKHTMQEFFVINYVSWDKNFFRYNTSYRAKYEFCIFSGYLPLFHMNPLWMKNNVQVLSIFVWWIEDTAHFWHTIIEKYLAYVSWNACPGYK